MGCFACFGSSKKQASGRKGLRREDSAGSFNKSASDKLKSKGFFDAKKEGSRGDESKIAAQTFTFRELASATKNFRPECMLGEGGFGRVYKGRLDSGQVVAVKQLDRNGLQGNREFLVEVLMLSLLHHPNLVNLIGYCADGDQRLLVYEFMQLGSLEDHLHDVPADKEPLGWNTRMKIAAGAARGLEYLHDKANPPVIYRDFKSSNILLGEGHHPKLSDFGLAKLGPVGDKTHVSTRVMGTYGYCAPEYAMTGQLTLKSDVYSFGVVLLELITGRKAIDNARPAGEHNLVAWARPLFKDRRKFPSMADPLLQGHYPMRGLYQALAVAAMCLQEQATTRPLIGDVVTALNYLASQTYDPGLYPANNSRFAPSTPSRDRREREKKSSGTEERRLRDRGARSSLPSAQGTPELRSKDPRFRAANGGGGNSSDDLEGGHRDSPTHAATRHAKAVATREQRDRAWGRAITTVEIERREALVTMAEGGEFQNRRNCALLYYDLPAKTGSQRRAAAMRATENQKQGTKVGAAGRKCIEHTNGSWFLAANLQGGSDSGGVFFISLFSLHTLAFVVLYSIM